MDYKEATVLSGLHTHLFTMGMMFMLVLLALAKLFPLLENKWFKRFWPLYNIAFIGTVIMLMVRGIVQVVIGHPSTMFDGMIAGIAGLNHIALSVAIIFLFVGLRQAVNGNDNKEGLI